MAVPSRLATFAVPSTGRGGNSDVKPSQFLKFRAGSKREEQLFVSFGFLRFDFTRPAQMQSWNMGMMPEAAPAVGVGDSVFFFFFPLFFLLIVFVFFSASPKGDYQKKAYGSNMCKRGVGRCHGLNRDVHPAFGCGYPILGGKMEDVATWGHAHFLLGMVWGENEHSNFAETLKRVRARRAHF